MQFSPGEEMMDNQPSETADTSPATDPKSRFQEIAASRRAAAAPVSAERSLWKGGYSAKAMYGTWLGAGVLTIAGIIALVLLGNQVAGLQMAGAGAIVLVWVVVLSVYLYRRFSVHYELTTQRFLHQHGILVRRTDRIEVIDIDDVAFTQGIVQRMLGVGTIHITSSDRSHPELHLSGIDQVGVVSNMLDDVRRDERRRRSLHIESV
jgi:membrane protein YdbS with pleckstrin-like domain